MRQLLLSYSPSNNFLALLHTLLYKSRITASLGEGAPNHFWFGAAHLKLLRIFYNWASLVAQMVKNLPAMQEIPAAATKSLQSCPTLRPHRRQPTRLLCPWDSPGKNTGALGREEFPGEGNGHPLQYSCLENSLDRGAWQATVHGVAQS